GGFIEGLTNMARPAVLSGTKEDLEKLVSRELELRMLHDSITDYARKLYSMEMTDSETKRLEALGTIVSNLQHIGETISVNMVSIGKERIDRGFKISEETLNKFMPYSSKVRESFDLSLKAVDKDDSDLAWKVVDMKSEVDRLADSMIEHLGERLLSDDPDRAVLYRVESQFVELIGRIYYFASMISKEIIEDSKEAAS
ncbi:MAG: PhoU domain-containing protein, partial [Thermodesulfobacteriota bacterium]